MQSNEAKMTVTPAKKAQNITLHKQNNIRVAAYCRVSTGEEGQLTSYRTQKAFYLDLIKKKPGWMFAGIYADEGISGTCRFKRDEFNRMMEDAMAGKIDYIVTKSISRFARNTIDTLDCVRKLKNLTPPVGVYFEKENVDTLDSTGEVILTIYSALAQEESQSISDNIRWGNQKRFQAGLPKVNLDRMIGYDLGENNEWIINEKQAEPVRYLFKRYACGAGATAIIREMNEHGWTTLSGSAWNHSSFNNVLRNEKFVGDLEMQKYVTSNFLTHKTVANRGQLPKYYIRDHHTPIIDRATWLICQDELSRDKPLASRDTGKICCVNIHCDKCGGLLEHRRRKFAAYWFNAENLQGIPAGRRSDPLYGAGKLCCVNEECKQTELYEIAVEQGFMELLYRLKRDYEKNGEASELARKHKESWKEGKDQSERIAELREKLTKLDLKCRQLYFRQAEAQKRENELKRPVIQENLQEEIQQGTTEMDDILSDFDKKRIAIEYEAERGSVDEMYDTLLADMLKHRAEVEEELRSLEKDSVKGMILKKKYELFLENLLALPEVNACGEKLIVHGLDDKEPVWTEKGVFLTTPDLLEFNREMYAVNVEAGFLDGDTITYKFIYGMEFTTTENQRSTKDFRFYRLYDENSKPRLAENEAEALGEAVQIEHRKKRKRKGQLLQG